MMPLRIHIRGGGVYHIDPEAGGNGGTAKVTTEGVEFYFSVMPQVKAQVGSAILSSYRSGDPDDVIDIILTYNE